MERPDDLAKSMDGPTDGELVRLAAKGQNDAFDVLIQRYQRQAVAVSYRLLGNINDAWEVSQDAFLKAVTHLDSLKEPDAFGGWLLRIVSNLSLNYRRSRKTRSSVPLDDILGPSQPDSGEASDPARSAEGHELGGRLQAALATLPERQRLALTMFTIEQMPQKQVAEALGCSVEAVKWHVFQGRKKLKELLKDVL